MSQDISMTRRSAWQAVVALSLSVALTAASGVTAAFAADYPDHAIRLIQPYPPGGSSDTSIRRITDKLGPLLGQPVVVENRPGSSGITATDLVAKSPADGYTLIFGTQQTHATNKALYSDLPYDPVKDFQPVGLFWQSVTLVAVSAKLPITSISELVAYAKAHPKELTFGSTGAGSAPHLGAADFASRAGIEINHVPYTNIGEAFQDLASGQLSLIFYPYGALKPLLEAKSITPLATTGSKRNPNLPDIPTMIEAGIPNFTSGSWNAIFAPAGTPKPIVDKLFKAFSEVMNMPDIKNFIEADGALVTVMTPEEVSTFLPGEIDRLGKIVEASGSKVR